MSAVSGHASREAYEIVALTARDHRGELRDELDVMGSRVADSHPARMGPRAGGTAIRRRVPQTALRREHMFDTVPLMDHAYFSLVVPDDPDLIGRLVTALAVQSDPPISVARSGQTVLAFESITGEMMLRSRVVQALEVAAGPDWQAVARPVG